MSENIVPYNVGQQIQLTRHDATNLLALLDRVTLKGTIEAVVVSHLVFKLRALAETPTDGSV